MSAPGFDNSDTTMSYYFEQLQTRRTKEEQKKENRRVNHLRHFDGFNPNGLVGRKPVLMIFSIDLRVDYETIVRIHLK